MLSILKFESMKLFGSGWVWLVRRKDGSLKIIKTFNQDNPWFLGFNVLIGIDNWEHAYYLKHNAEKGDYLDAIMSVINWEDVEKRYINIINN
jgi:Fe-Mn family superoxide dismutase